MKIKKTPEGIYGEYESGKDFNENIKLYENVEKNNWFYTGDQWHGINAPDLTKPVFNIMKRVVNYYISQLVSDDIAVHITPFDETPENKVYADIISQEVEAVIERANVKAQTRLNLKNCCVDGDTATFIYFDPDIETNQSYKGDIRTEIVDNTHYIFGNPYSHDIQKQPFILVVQRLFTEQVREYAKEQGVKDYEEIVPDDDVFNYDETANQTGLTTVITKFWKEKIVKTETDAFGIEKEVSHTTVKYMKTTAKKVLRKEIDTGYKEYPISTMSWEEKRNSYHGTSPMTGLIPNQIFINKIFAMCMVYMTNMGFPRIFYDQNKIAKLTNDVTKATAMPQMDMMGKVIDAVKAPDFSNQIIQLVNSTISYTKDFMGASDAALGNVSNPNNTSAIIAVQQASTVPLEIQRLEFYNFFEGIVRSVIDIMAVSYGTRIVHITESQAKTLGLVETDMMGNVAVDEYGNPRYRTTTSMDFDQMRNFNYSLNVDIGQSTYWNETTQVQTLDNLFDKGIITDATIYLEGIPDKYVPNKAKIIEALKSQQAQAQAQMQAQNQVRNQAPQDENINPVTGEPNQTPLEQAYAKTFEVPLPTDQTV